MLSYLVRQTLLDALAGGPPYHVSARHSVPAVTYMRLLTDLELRGLITSGPYPLLTEAGITEASWFANPRQTNEQGR
jgi:hypothetical protein